MQLVPTNEPICDVIYPLNFYSTFFTGLGCEIEFKNTLRKSFPLGKIYHPELNEDVHSFLYEKVKILHSFLVRSRIKDVEPFRTNLASQFLNSPSSTLKYFWKINSKRVSEKEEFCIYNKTQYIKGRCQNQSTACTKKQKSWVFSPLWCVSLQYMCLTTLGGLNQGTKSTVIDCTHKPVYYPWVLTSSIQIYRHWQCPGPLSFSEKL